MSSSQKDRETILACVQMGCDDYISKPFDREIILKKLHKLGISTPGEDTKVAEASPYKRILYLNSGILLLKKIKKC